MSAGFIYVLVNSSMPGLIKVGKTTRDPTARVAELSGATGVATPFILAFKQFFEDCDTAEFQIHQALEGRGHRVAAGREFFRAEADEIIHLVIDAAKSSIGSGKSPGSDDDADILLNVPDDEFTLPERRPAPPWAAVMEQADNYYYGEKGEIEDHVMALSLYKDAIRLGGLVAYERVGFMYQLGEGVAESSSKALEIYRSGAEKGNYFCWAEMAGMFHRMGSDGNATKCWKRFFDARRRKTDTNIEPDPGKFLFTLCTCCVYCMLDNDHAVLVDYLRSHVNEIRAFCERQIVYTTPGESVDYYLGIKRWISSI